jgi:hypothetical protein
VFDPGLCDCRQPIENTCYKVTKDYSVTDSGFQRNALITQGLLVVPTATVHDECKNLKSTVAEFFP